MKFLRRIGEISLKRRLAKAIFKASEAPLFTPLLAVLFPAENLQKQQANIQFCQKLEEITGIKTLPLVFMPKRLDHKVRFSFPHYNLGDLNFLGIPTNHDVDLFKQRDYHTVVNLDTSNYLSLHHLSHSLRARHKLAIRPKFQKLYDIVIQSETLESDDNIRMEIIEILTRITT